jgi:UDP-N-acetylmuramoyl-tripeptide--D-alanyl-D-alanine ligase
VTGVVAAVALTVGLVAEATGGTVAQGSATPAFTGVSIDTRTIQPGMLFVAIRGERLDGHDFVAQAVAKGARGVLVDHAAKDAGSAAVIKVKDTLAGLQALGAAVRRLSGVRVVAVTGSAGKTTTKELIADVLSTDYRVFRNRGNLNNHIGLPLSLAGLADGPDVAVVEFGMNHAGEIRRLVQIARPDVRVWINVGDAHIGYFGSRQAIAAAKAEILEEADSRTLAVVNADDELVRAAANNFPGRLITFGIDRPAAIRAVDVTDRGFDGVRARVDTPDGPINLQLSMPGRAHLLNALAAVAVSREFGITPEAIAARLAAARPVTHRGSDVRLARGIRVIDDSYNASPAAMDVMLRALAATPTTGRRIAVLGEMRELGDSSPALHEATGRAAASAGVDLLIAVGGSDAAAIVRGATAAGVNPDRARYFADAAAATEPVRDALRSGDLVLIKGSRATGMDAIVRALEQAEAR